MNLSDQEVVIGKVYNDNKDRNKTRVGPGLDTVLSIHANKKQFEASLTGQF